MKLLLKLSALTAAAIICAAPAMAATYDDSQYTVSPQNTEISYQTMLVTDNAQNVYFMDTASAGLGAGMKAALMNGGLKQGDYILRLKSADGTVINESFTVGSKKPEGTEMIYAGSGNISQISIDGELVKTESRGYYADEISVNSKIVVSFTYKNQSYSYTYGKSLPNIEGTIGVQIDNVPTSIKDMKVTITEGERADL